MAGWIHGRQAEGGSVMLKRAVLRDDDDDDEDARTNADYNLRLLSRMTSCEDPECPV